MTFWQRKYFDLLAELAEDFDGKFQIKKKEESRKLWVAISLALRILFLGLPITPNMLANHTTLGKTFWVAKSWESISWRNKFMILDHERVYMDFIWKNSRGEPMGWIHYTFHLVMIGLFPMPIFYATYRQWILVICWQTNIFNHVANNHGRLHPMVREHVINMFSGRTYIYAFTRRRAEIALDAMESVAKRFFYEGRLHTLIEPKRKKGKVNGQQE